MTTAPLTGLLDKQTAAQYACVSVRTLDRWIQSGLPVYRHTPRSKVLLKTADVEAFLMRQQRLHPNLNQLVDDVFATLQKNTALKSANLNAEKLKGAR